MDAETTVPPGPTGPTTRAGVGAAAVVVAAVLAARMGLPPYDDAFFFVRFARNLVEHGTFAWNVADGPVYGNTSQLFQAVVAAVHLVAGEHTVAATRVGLAACWLGAVALLRGSVPALVVLASPVGLATIVSGMETATVLMLGAALLAELGRARGARDAVLVLLGVSATLARPDGGLLVAVTLALERRWVALAATLAGVAACMAGFYGVYGTPVPLSFLTKSGLGGVYDAEFLAVSRQAKLRHVLLFAWVVAPWLRPHRWLVPAGVFAAYHVVANVDVMGLHARFYAPALPWIAAAAGAGAMPSGRGWAALGGWAVVGAVLVGLGAVPGDAGWLIGRISPWVYASYAVAVLVAHAPRPEAGPLAAGALALGVLATADRPAPPPDDDGYAARLEAQVTSFRGLRQLARCLGTDVRVMHSEIGVPGMVLRDGHVTDLGGLMSPALLGRGGAAEAVEAACLAERPDAVFLPHRHYATLNRALLEGACLRGYERVVAKGSSPLYVRRDRLAAYRCGGG